MPEWVDNTKRTWAEWAAIRVLQVGPIPKHLAIIMDGNRRFARLFQKDTLEGHSQGFQKLTEVLGWCRDLDISEVTVYAFSIENFKRSKHEVEGLMNLAEQKFRKLLEEVDKLNEHGICIRVVGNLDLISLPLRNLMAKAMLATQYNSRCCLNLAMAYTSREEISTAIYEISRGINEEKILNLDVSESLIEQCLYTTRTNTSPPDLLIRTSGVRRLSDFLLWQTSFTQIYFSNVLWPELTIWNLLAGVFQFQRHFHTLSQLRKDAVDRCASDDKCSNLRVQRFLSDLNADRLNKLKQIASG